MVDNQRFHERIRNTFKEYPLQFWILILGIFIDLLGNRLLFPFLTLYITKRFNVGMTEVGLLFGVNSVVAMAGGMLGGALTDRLGRKRMILYGLIFSGLANLGMGLVGSFGLLSAMVLLGGVVGSISGPAQGAIVADLLPEEKRAGGFAILRVVSNLTWIFGTIIGGLLATYSYLFLFLCDVVASTIAAVILLFAIKETLPASREDEPKETVTQTFAGYRHVLRDTTFVLFIGACIMMGIVYLQQYATLSVYLRDTHGVSEQNYGYLASMNATMVVLFQFLITRWIAKYPPMIIMAVGTLLYAIGFGMYGFVSTYFLFVVAMIIIVIGEMFIMPTSQALVAKIAPEDMRGRYMAAFGLSWQIPWAVGPFLAGLVMDNLDPRWVWYIAGLVGLIAAGLFTMLQPRVKGLFAQAETQANPTTS